MTDTTDTDDRDWREWAYLSKSRWPEAIPNCGPAREYGPKPWGRKTHYDPEGLDKYPASHPGAASVGDAYMGDVCPYCGVPLAWTERVVLITGTRGIYGSVDAVDEPTPAYHPECWDERVAEGATPKGIKSLTEFTA
jgi:hypothetical protein